VDGVTETTNDIKNCWVEVETDNGGPQNYVKEKPKPELTCEGTVF